MQDNSISSINRPLANFENLFQYGGFKKAHDTFTFLYSEEDTYDPTTDTRTIRSLDEFTLDYIYTTESFDEYYFSLLEIERGASCQNIDAHYYELTDENERRMFIEKSLKLLDYLVDVVKSDYNLNNRDVSIKVLYRLNDFIRNKYAEFLPVKVKVHPIPLEATLDTFPVEVKVHPIPVEVTLDTISDANINPYPRIFTTAKAFDKFEKLLAEFGDGNENLSNYSFVYHRMVKDKLIFEYCKPIEFVYFLLNFDINLDRIKPMKQLGKTKLREGIYNSIK